MAAMLGPGSQDWEIAAGPGVGREYLSRQHIRVRDVGWEYTKWELQDLRKEVTRGK